MAKNLRIIYNNAADRATITSSSQASASLGPSNLKTDVKAQVLRSVGTSQTVTCTWTSLEQIGGVVFPFTNITGVGTIRVRGYTNVNDPTPVFDTGAVLACPGLPLGMWNWGDQGLGTNAFAYGGGAYARVWVANPTSVRKLVIDLSDPSSSDGFIDLGRLVCGSYWEPQKNFPYGSAAVTPCDNSETYRSEGGELNTDTGTKYRKQVITLEDLTPADAKAFWSIMMGNGKSRPILASLFPDNDDTALEQRHMIYGKITTPEEMGIPSLLRYASSVEQEEI